jgi:hypothetical protein
MFYNVDKSLSSLTDAQVTKVCRTNNTQLAANKLADFLSDMLNNKMQMSGWFCKPKPVKDRHAIARYY